MNPQLASIVAQFENGRERLHRLAQVVPREQWIVRPQPGRWSVAECVAHLNLTTNAFRPLVERGLEEARQLARGGQAPGRYSPGILGGLLRWALSRPGRFRVKTTAAFTPGAVESVEGLVAEFNRLQDEQVGWVRAAEGLPLGAVKIASPFDRRVRYNLYATLSIVAIHQLRHLAQAEDAAQAASRR